MSVHSSTKAHIKEMHCVPNIGEAFRDFSILELALAEQRLQGPRHETHLEQEAYKGTSLIRPPPPLGP